MGHGLCCLISLSNLMESEESKVCISSISFSGFFSFAISAGADPE